MMTRFCGSTASLAIWLIKCAGSSDVNLPPSANPHKTFGLIETVEKAAQIYMLTAHLPRINTITDTQLKDLAELFGVTYRKDFLNL
ncbi:hypothetical protein [Merdimmobilis hominis]|uniref:hypothetical protein n=1 Tax=Merdimmobilis hominis TaxID=2897707 RepID=UPI001FAF978E|nr:hypothetical protein [Merdimmobilis hominis]